MSTYNDHAHNSRRASRVLAAIAVAGALYLSQLARDALTGMEKAADAITNTTPTDTYKEEG